jgi:type III pantothenate kinase
MNPLLLIDAGNTRLKWAEVTARGAIKEEGWIATPAFTASRAAALRRTYARHRIVIASVVPTVSRTLRKVFPEALLVKGGLRGLPLAFSYPKPAEIGADRIAAAIGAGKLAPAIIISCGTATAFSVLDARGQFCGGAITPGVETQSSALAGATAQLPETRPASGAKALGKSTRAAIRAGVLLGWQGGVIEIVRQLRQEVGASARVIVTGGEARHLRGVRGLRRVEFRPLLVFEGLRIIAASLPDR